MGTAALGSQQLLGVAHGRDAPPRQHHRRHTAALPQKSQQDVLGAHIGVPHLPRRRHSHIQRGIGFIRKPFEPIHTLASYTHNIG